MELLAVLLFIMVIILIASTIMSGFAFVIQWISKKNKKVPGIFLASTFGATMVFLIPLIILIVVMDNTPATSPPIGSSNNSTIETTNRPTTSTTNSSDKEEVKPADEDEIETDLITEDVEEPVEDGPDPADLNNYQTDIDTRDIERNPDDFKDELIMFEGKIVQVMEDGVNTSYRISVNDDYDRMVYVETLTSTLDERLLEDDYITVYGVFIELITYETVIGGSVTLPGFVTHGERIILIGE